MRRFVKTVILLTWTVLVSAAHTSLGAPSQQGASVRTAEGTLPKDVYSDSLNRLPLIKRADLDERGKKAYDAAMSRATSPGGPQGAAAIRLHGSGVNVRWASPLGRQLTELAILTTARAHDQPYEWSLHEMDAVAVGLEPAVIDVVRHRKPLTGLGDREAIIIQAGREIFDTHQLSSDTYARALKLLDKSNLVDVVDLMASYAGTAARLTAFNQHMPSGWKQFLPLPFTPPNDIDSDSRSRLPLIRSQGQNQQATPVLYSRTLAPEGTGPGHIGRHGAGVKSLEASVGRRLIALAILVTAREHDAQYDWTVNELAALQDGLEPATIDIVRHRKPLTGVAGKEAGLIEFGRELFGQRYVSAETYARALKAFGERDLVDFVGVMAQHAADAALLAAFDQHLPAGQKPLLPIP
jgi:4-carboxymuconolactone decarboxylase